MASNACLDQAHALSACLNNASGTPAPDLHDTGRIVHTSLRDRRVIATTDLPDGRVVVDAVLLRPGGIERAVLQDADRAIDAVLACGRAIAATILGDLDARRRPSGLGACGEQRRMLLCACAADAPSAPMSASPASLRRKADILSTPSRRCDSSNRDWQDQASTSCPEWRTRPCSSERRRH